MANPIHPLFLRMVVCKRRRMTIMPEMVVHFDVSRERSITALQQAMMEDQKIFLVAQKSIETEDPGQEDVYSIGTCLLYTSPSPRDA